MKKETFVKENTSMSKKKNGELERKEKNKNAVHKEASESKSTHVVRVLSLAALGSLRNYGIRAVHAASPNGDRKKNVKVGKDKTNTTKLCYRYRRKNSILFI